MKRSRFKEDQIVAVLLEQETSTIFVHLDGEQDGSVTLDEMLKGLQDYSRDLVH